MELTPATKVIILLNNHFNIANVMVSLVAPSALCDMTKRNMPSNATFKPQMPISSCAHDTSMSVYMPPMKPMQSAM